MNLTRDGDVFSQGVSQFGVSGHGGARDIATPQIIKPLRDKRIIQIACGESHSLVLTDRYDVYAWGRGFEGQLGVSNSVEVASTPQYLKFFNRKQKSIPVSFIACGAFYSLAIT